MFAVRRDCTHSLSFAFLFLFFLFFIYLFIIIFLARLQRALSFSPLSLPFLVHTAPFPLLPATNIFTHTDSDYDSGDENDKRPLKEGEGITFEGVRFSLPKTSDIMSRIFKPSQFDVGLMATWLLFVMQLYIVRQDLPWYFWAGQSLFWRLMYNVGLGFLLKQQSDTCTITEFVKNLQVRVCVYVCE